MIIEYIRWFIILIFCQIVFQVSWLLQFFCAKFEFDQNTTAFLNQNLELYSGAATEEDFDLLKTTLHSVNLKTCYERYKVLRSSSKTSEGNESIAALEKDLADNDVALWMSGLLCGVTPQCISEMRIFVPGFRNARVPFFLAEQPQSKNTLPSQSDKNCLPGCGCDNPWAFISAAYKK